MGRYKRSTEAPRQRANPVSAAEYSNSAAFHREMTPGANRSGAESPSENSYIHN
jgi:hypothetical protein